MTPPNIDPKTLVDPELRPALDMILMLMPPEEEITQQTLDAIRARGVAMTKPFAALPAVMERQIAGVGQAPDVTVYVINSDTSEICPAILHLHGGGFVAGSAKASVADMQVIARALDCVIVTVEYRLAPETVFPGALEDNLAALRWLFANAGTLGVDPARIAVMGESAGGGHAAMLTIAARGELPVCFQALTYPMLDDRTGSISPQPQHIGTFLWRPELNVAGWTALLGHRPETATAPDGAVPARVADLSGLPPTFIGVGALDLFVAEDLEFARRLLEAGVPTEMILVPGAFHGFEAIVATAAVSQRYRLLLLNSLARAFGRPELSTAPIPAPMFFGQPSASPAA